MAGVGVDFTEEEDQFVVSLTSSYSSLDQRGLASYAASRRNGKDYYYLSSCCNVGSCYGGGSSPFEELVGAEQAFDPRECESRDDRFTNIVAFPKSSLWRNLNASTILPRVVATQWPTLSTAGRLLHECLQNRASVIIALGHVPEDRADPIGGVKYWEPRSYPDYNLEVTTSEVFQDKEVGRALQHRDLLLNGQHTVRLIRMSGWEDFSGADPHTFHVVQKLATIIRACQREDKLCVVHCRAGVGRTGTLAMIAAGWDQLQREKALCPQELFVRLRLRRCMAVQTRDQYRMVAQFLSDVDASAPVPPLSELLFHPK